MPLHSARSLRSPTIGLAFFVALVTGPCPVLLAQQAQPSAAPAAPEAPVQEGSDRRAGRGGQDRAPQADLDQAPRLPAPSSTAQRVTLKNRTLDFTATVEALPLRNGKGSVTGEVVTTAFLLNSTEPRRRPVLFAMNGGPGSASVWLDLGLLGPWRLPMSGEGLSPSASAIAQPNEETWLDFADLVFIDPIGTGFSRIVGKDDDAEKSFYSVNGDVEALSVVIREWLVKHDRLTSPKYLIGESYSGLRGPKIVHALQTGQGVGLKGMILVSPVLDFTTITGPRQNAINWIALLPSMAASKLDEAGPVSQDKLDEVEAYAGGEYMSDFFRGEGDMAGLDRMSKRVAAYSGLDPVLVRKLGGRIDVQTFLRERHRDQGIIESRYDATVGGLAPYPNASYPFAFKEPLTSAIEAPFTSAMLDLYARFKWQPDRKYEIFSSTANNKWQWGNRLSSVQSLTDLQAAMALDPQLKVLVAHGYADLATPYFGSKLLLRQLPPLGRPDRIGFKLYPGGHMFYSRDDSRIAFRKEGEAMIGSGRD